MRFICAWCGSDIEGEEGDFSPLGPISHGICDECASRLSSETGASALEDYLDHLEWPVLLVGPDTELIYSNQAANGVIGEAQSAMKGEPAGNWLQCSRAKLPGGCGHTQHCTGCVVRNSVETTARTGEPVEDALAVIHPVSGGPPKVRYRISTERVCDAVMLRMEDVND